MKSLTEQTFRDIEIVAVENGSADNTLELLKKHASADSRIKVLTAEITGQQNARNLGIKNSSGEYLMFCDADDWFAPDMCEIMHDAITGSKTDVACCNVKLEYAGDLSPEEKRRRDTGHYYSHDMSGKFRLDNSMIMNTNVLLCNKIMRRDTVEKILEHYSPVRAHEDRLFWYLFALNAKSVFHVDRKLYHYLLRPGSVMSGITMAGTKTADRMELIRIADSIRDYLKEKKKQPPAELKLLTLIYEEHAHLLSEMLEENELQEICDIINESAGKMPKLRAFFIPEGRDIINADDSRSLLSLTWNNLSLRFHRKFNRLIGKKVSERLEEKIMKTERKIAYRKSISVSG